MDIYLVRHGQTDWNRDHRLQGWADIPLNERGRAEARAIAEKLRDVPLERAYCSDLDRAYETAETIVAGRGIEIEADPRLREMGFGPLEGEDYAKAATDETLPLHELFVHPDTYVPEFGGESLPYVGARLDSFLISTLAPLAAKGFTGNVLIAAHGIVTRELYTRAAKLPYSEFWRIRVGNCFACVLSYDGKDLRLKTPSL